MTKNKIFLYNIALKYFQSEIRKNISLQYCTETLSKPVKTFLCSAGVHEEEMGILVAREIWVGGSHPLVQKPSRLDNQKYRNIEILVGSSYLLVQKRSRLDNYHLRRIPNNGSFED